MSSAPADAMAEAKDPVNVLLHRMPVRRLEGEEVRDSILAVAGTLDRTMYGPSIPTYLSEFMTTSRRPGESGPLDGARRRTLYIRVQRNFLQPMQLAFDFPLPDSTVGKRTTSNIPAQALILMNDPFVESQAKAWGEAVAQDFEASTEERVRGLYLRALGRPATPAELDAMLNFIDEQGATYGLPEEKRAGDPRVWSDVCHVMFTLKEFIFIG